MVESGIVILGANFACNKKTFMEVKSMVNIDQLTINTIRVLAAESVQKANSGHPGLPLGVAPLAYTLWSKHLRHSPSNPEWKDRDRFILSAGHGSMLLYSLLHLFGYGLEIEDLMNFRQWNSKTPGHPEFGHTKGVEITTGPLGQGVANGVGMAMAEAYLANKFNRQGYNVVDHHTYVLASDGCFMEGVASEAASLAGTLGLGKLILMYDSNSITIEGSTDLAFKEDVGKRFEAYGWQILNVENGNDVEAISNAIAEAKAETKKPSLIEIRTEIGYGCPAKQGKASAHGEPLGEKNVFELKEYLKYTSETPFHVSVDVKEYMIEVREYLNKFEAEWIIKFQGYKKEYPELAIEYEKWHSKDVSVDLLNDREFWNSDTKDNATRNSSHDVLNRIANYVPNLIGGSADLGPSTKTLMKEKGDFSSENYSGRNLHFGVREHAMGAIGNGMAAHGGVIPYVATFFVFSDYMKPAMRLSALMGLTVVYVMTHDSIGVGEDGPTHQPIEHLAALRSIPNFIDFRPADFKETAAGWFSALTRKNSPTALILTRQTLPQFKETGVGALKGAYILLESEKETPDIILIASGSEVKLIYEAHKVLKDKAIDARVISMPSMKLFDEQSEEYKNSILPEEVKNRLAVEAASSFGWHKYIGLSGAIISMDHFGASAPSEVLFSKFGFTVDNIVNISTRMVKK